MMRSFFIFMTLCLSTMIYATDPQLTVSGEATLHKPADQLIMSAGIVSQDKEAKKALQSNGYHMEAILQVLRQSGLQPKDYSTGHFDIRPIYSVQPPKASADWQPTIVGYEVSNLIEIHTDQLRLAGQLVDALNQVGANNIQVSFGLKEPVQYRAEVIQAAAVRAQEDAATLARALGVKLGNLVEVELDPSSASLFGAKSSHFMLSPGAAQETPLVPGEIPVHAAVQLTYAIIPSIQ